MKICILTHTFPRFKNDTTAAFMHPLVLGLQKAGHQVVVLTPYNSEFKPNDFPYKIVTYKYIWPSFFHLLGYSRTLKAGAKLTLTTYLLAPFFYFFGILALFRLCRLEKFNLISSHWILPNGFIAFVVSRIVKIPYTVTLPGSDVYVAKKNKLFSKMTVAAASHANVILADSPQFLEDLISLDAQVKKSQIITYPVDEKKLKPTIVGQKKLRRSLGLKQNDLTIMAVARLLYKKGISYLFRAVAPLIAKNKKVKLIIIGDGDLREELKNLAQKLKINKATKFIYQAPREEMNTYYNLGDIFVASSIRDQEGNMDDSPVSLFEAMACGLPVVATNFPGIACVVEDKISGFLVEEKDILGIRQALKKLLKSSSLRKKMGKKGRQIVKKKLSIKRIGERYTKLFFDIINL